MKEEIVLVHGTFNDIYGWGKGFYTQEKARQWKEALEEVDDIFWKVFTDRKGYGDVNYLVSTGGSIFLHPMDFRAILHSSGCHSADTFDCNSLKTVCEKIAEHCGGTFSLKVSKPFEVEADMVPYVEGIHNTL